MGLIEVLKERFPDAKVTLGVSSSGGGMIEVKVEEGGFWVLQRAPKSFLGDLAASRAIADYFSEELDALRGALS